MLNLPPVKTATDAVRASIVAGEIVTVMKPEPEWYKTVSGWFVNYGLLTIASAYFSATERPGKWLETSRLLQKVLTLGIGNHNPGLGGGLGAIGLIFGLVAFWYENWPPSKPPAN